MWLFKGKIFAFSVMSTLLLLCSLARADLPSPAGKWTTIDDQTHKSKSVTIVAPETGQTYKCSVTPSVDGKTLAVRGDMGVSLLGRTQTWQKADE